MKIFVGGAGAGKTRNMSSRILGCNIPQGKIVYCVAFTNSAVENIRARLLKTCGEIPSNIRVSTIHSFLYTELVRPFYHLLYGKRYRGISIISLPDDVRFHNARVKELDEQGLLHQTVIPQRAKWVADKKSGDAARIQALREKLLTYFASYCYKVFVDEAQDLNKDMTAVLKALESVGIDIELYGDPKQDLRGYGCFRELIDMHESAIYDNVCHRCPQMHLRLSNTLARREERQTAAKHNCTGSIDVYYESIVDVNELIEADKYDLVYISKKNDRYETHSHEFNEDDFPTLLHEVTLAVSEKFGSTISELETKRIAYYLTEHMLSFVANGGQPKEAITKCINAKFFDYEKKRFARMASALKGGKDSPTGKISVKSIDAVKGLEGTKCLFILTQDLVPYLLGEKMDDNKTKHLLYVALTRSLDELAILVTHEVERAYSKEKIESAIEAPPFE